MNMLMLPETDGARGKGCMLNTRVVVYVFSRTALAKVVKQGNNNVNNIYMPGNDIEPLNMRLHQHVINIAFSKQCFQCDVASICISLFIYLDCSIKIQKVRKRHVQC